MKQFLLLICTVCSLQSFSQNNLTEEQKLQMVLDDWARKGATGNIDSTMYFWADDAIILDHGKNINGKPAIKQMMQGMGNVPGFKMVWDAKPVKLEVAKSGDMAYMILQNTMSVPDSTGKILTIRNTALETWKKDNAGIWKCTVVMMTPDDTAVKQ